MEINYQIIQNVETTKDYLVESLNLTYSEYSEISIYTLNDMIEIKYQIKINIDKFITGFKIIIDDISQEHIEYFIKAFHEILNDKNKTIALVKYHDEARLKDYSIIYQEIAKIEMELREILSFIFYHEYPNDNFDLFKDFTIKLPKIDKPNSNDLNLKLENELFYTLFSDYISFDKPREISNYKEFITFFENSETFEDLKDKIFNRGIRNRRYIEFINKIKQDLNAIEEVRNSIAHNRAISIRASGYYETALLNLNKSFKEFWEDINEIELEQEVINNTNDEVEIDEVEIDADPDI